MSVYGLVYKTVYFGVYGSVLRIPATRRTLYGSPSSTALLGTDTRLRSITGNAARSTIYGR